MRNSSRVWWGRHLVCPLIVLSALAFTSSTTADEIRFLHTAREAAEERVRLLHEAGVEINAVYFIVGSDVFSLTGLTLLRAAARRGVVVRLLVDARYNKIPKSVQAHLIAEGVEIRVYHPFRVCKPRWITRRLHDKLLIVDGVQMIGGGRNIESPYFDLGRQVGRRDYVDIDLLVIGEAVQSARAYFMRLWESGEVRHSRASAAVNKQQQAEELLDGYESWLQGRIAARRVDRPSSRSGLYPVGDVTFLHDPVGKKGAAPGVGDALLALLDGAKMSVVIESPYLVPSRAFKRGLQRARDRGVTVRILTNSLATTDNLLPQAGYVGEKKGLVRSGVELWEMTGTRCLHGKAAIIDEETVIIGSFNLDPRSEHLNTELAMVFTDRDRARDLLAELDGHLDQAVRIDRNGRPEGSALRFPGVSRCKILKLQMLRLISPLIKKQL